MPYVRNDNPHGVRTGNSRVAANSVGYVSDEDLKVYETYEGVEKLSDAKGKEAVEEQRAGGMTPESPSHDIHEGLAELRVAHRMAAVAAPLQVVRGDDDAPLGPPSGVITTKQAVAQDSPEAKRAFADHEHAEVPEGASPVEQRQAEATRDVEEVAQTLAERLQSGEPVDGDSDADGE